MYVYCIKMSTAPYDNLTDETIQEYYDDAIADVKDRTVGSGPNSLIAAINTFNNEGFKDSEKRKKHLGEDTQSMPVRAPKLLLKEDGKTIIFTGAGMKFNEVIKPVQMGGRKRNSRRGNRNSKRRSLKKRRGNSRRRN